MMSWWCEETSHNHLLLPAPHSGHLNLTVVFSHASHAIVLHFMSVRLLNLSVNFPSLVKFKIEVELVPLRIFADASMLRYKAKVIFLEIEISPQRYFSLKSRICLTSTLWIGSTKVIEINERFTIFHLSKNNLLIVFNSAHNSHSSVLTSLRSYNLKSSYSHLIITSQVREIEL